MRKKKTICFNEVFITQETREKIYEAAEERGEKEVDQYMDDLYNTLDRALRTIAVFRPDRKEWIIYTPDRRIGKTRALLRVANEYNAPIIAKECERERLQYVARELGYEKPWIVSPAGLLMGELKVSPIRIIIKMETVKISEIRNMVKDYYVVGIEEV